MKKQNNIHNNLMRTEMKYIMKLFLGLTVVLMPLVSTAQTSNTKWVRLYDFLQEPTLVLSNSEDLKYFPNKNPEYSLLNMVPISKVAYSKKAPRREFRGNEVQGKVLPYLHFIFTDFSNLKGKNIIEQDFTITDNGKKTKESKISVNDEGWKVYDFKRPLVLSDILDKRYYSESDYGYSKKSYPNFQFNDSELALDVMNLQLSPLHILEYMYVALDPSLLQQWEQNAQNYRSSLHHVSESTAKPFKTDNLDNGIICEHYKNSYSGDTRTYRKPNGDFVTIAELQDKRDEKTMDLSKGIDRAIDIQSDNIQSIGPFKITTPNGGNAYYDGEYLTITFGNGSRYEDKVEKYDDSDEFSIDFKIFQEPSDEILSILTIYNLKYYRSLSGSNYLIYGGENIGRDMPYVPKVSDPAYLYYKQHYNPNAKKRYRNNNHSFFDVIYQVNPKSGIERYGFYFDNSIIKTPSLINSAGYDRDSKVHGVSTNSGDRIKSYDSNHFDVYLTLTDGRVVERFGDPQEYPTNIIKVTYPNGDKFVENNNLRFNDFMTNIENVRPLNTALIKADGTEVLYKDGLDPEQYQAMLLAQEQAEKEKAALEEKRQEEERLRWEKRKAEQDAKDAKERAYYNKICGKYGKKNVDKALHGTFEVGMNFNIIKDLADLMDWIKIKRDGQNTTTTWYKIYFFNHLENTVGVSNYSNLIEYVKK